ncbi:MAG: hypothetical protein Q7T54_00410 [Candidatus Levybacteria bacterium]|nr:hypothetical protein [Candidatus Levybacteria bacterium]
MKKLILSFLLLFVFLFSATQSFAYVTVKGYYRSNGTYVRPHVRSNPNGIKYDNYGYQGGSRYNSSFYDSNYSNTWRTPSYYTDNDYYTGKSLYNSNNYNYNYNYGWDY